MSHKGFTLIELVMVLVLVGIMAVFVAPRLGNITATNAGAFTDKLRADIRYAQNLAMTRNGRARVYYNGTGTAPNPGYAVVIDTSASRDCSSFAPAIDPAGGVSLSITLNTGSYAGITIMPSMNCLEYDALGRPYNCSAVPPNCMSPAGGMTISVNANAAVVETVTITDRTGAVN